MYEGDYYNGEKSGNGKEYNAYGEPVYEGEFFNGKRNGKGIKYYMDESLKFEGEFRYGKKWNGCCMDVGEEEVYDFEDYVDRKHFFLNGKRVD